MAAALDIRLLALDENGGSEHLTDSVQAYDYYLQALESQARGSTKALDRAHHLLELALIEDPDFVEAQLAQVRNYVLGRDAGAGSSPMDEEEARRLVDEIILSQPTLLAARQFDLMLRRDAAMRAMDVNAANALMEELVDSFDEGAGDTTLRRGAATYLILNQRLDEARDLVDEALVTDPLNVDLLVAHHYLLWGTDGMDASARPLETALLEQPEHPLALFRIGVLEINRGRLLQGMRYFRRSELADSEDSRSATIELALTFNELRMYDRGQRWLEKFRRIARDRLDAIELEVHMAAERNDEVTLRRIVPGAITAFFEGEVDRAPQGLLLNEFAVIMLSDDRAQEGLDIVARYYPQMFRHDYAGPADWEELLVFTELVAPLARSLSDEATNRQTTERFVAQLEEKGIPMPGDVQVRVQYELYGHEAGKAAFLEYFNDDLYFLAKQWFDFNRAAWAEGLRSDPEVQVAIEGRERKIDFWREKALVMVDEPIWQ